MPGASPSPDLGSSVQEDTTSPTTSRSPADASLRISTRKQQRRYAEVKSIGAIALLLLVALVGGQVLLSHRAELGRAMLGEQKATVPVQLEAPTPGTMKPEEQLPKPEPKQQLREEKSDPTHEQKEPAPKAGEVRMAVTRMSRSSWQASVAPPSLEPGSKLVWTEAGSMLKDMFWLPWNIMLKNPMEKTDIMTPALLAPSKGKQKNTEEEVVRFSMALQHPCREGKWRGCRPGHPKASIGFNVLKLIAEDSGLLYNI